MTIYLADKSAWEQRRTHDHVAAGFVDLLRQGQLACCEMIALELLYSARNLADHGEVAAELHAMRWMKITNTVMTRALEVQELLVPDGLHRRPINDLIIAACAELNNATVLHHDRDFEIIAAVTDQPVTRALDLWPSAPEA